ncbi:MAG: IPT/TIG domain-containing protein [Verrucomicrobia bacterium]|nr:IPT/TIG domain-containing protein [Verrucomicrobiota bacterium]
MNPSESDWQGIRAAYETGSHAFQPRDGVGWQARNSGQKWTTAFAPDGFLVEPDGGGWQWGLALKSYGFGRLKTGVSGDPEIGLDGRHLSYKWDGTIREWFLNDSRGLEHGFVIDERPAFAARGDLELLMEIRGGLRPVISGDGRGVDFRHGNGVSAVTYTGLKAWDADGKMLPARFEDAGGQTIRLLVDERDARYPITIDPIAQQAYLKASNTGYSDRFGYAVAIDGDTAVVGAPYENSNATGVNGNQADNSAPSSGAVYVFVRTGGVWSQQAYLKAENTGSEDLFGSAVAVSGDTVVVGAWQEDSNATGVNGNQSDNSAPNSGAVYVFTRTAGVWSQQAYLKASNSAAGDRFGISVDVDGDTIAVGASQEDSNATGVGGNQADNSATNSGAAYIFARSGGVWTQQAYVKASNTGASDFFGGSVAVSADTLVVGAINESSNATGVNGSQGDHISTQYAGAAYVFTRSGGVWSQQAYLKAGNTGANDNFGISVDVDGDTAVVGANREAGNATGVNAPLTGGSGTQSDNSAQDCGAAYVFTRSSGTWSQQAYLKASNTGAYDSFGLSVAVDGDTLVVGAPYESANATGVNAPLSGGSGTQADNSATYAGAAYMFARSSGTWSQLAYLKASNTQAIDLFGGSVAVSGITILAGAAYEDGGTTGVNSTPDEAAGDSGAVYLFTLPVPPPVVTGVSPPTGNAVGGTPVTITGTNLTGTAAVTIGGAAATGVTVVNDTTVTAITPPGEVGAASVQVTTPGGTNAPNTLFAYGAPDIALAQTGALSSNTGNINFGNGGSVVLGWTEGHNPPVTFTITNPGTADLSGISIAKSGPDADDFTVSAPSSATIPVGPGTATFTVTFNPSSNAYKLATLQISSNVIGDKNPFTIHIHGQTLSTSADTDSDGLNDATEFRLAALGFDWQTQQTALVETYFATAPGAGLFKPDQVRALKLPTPRLERDPLTGAFHLTFGLETSASVDPAAFSPFPVTEPQISVRDGKLEIRFSGQGDAAFFRLTTE